jgi:hypothetical protein
MIELDKLLESKYPNYEMKLYFLQILFEVANYLNLSSEQKIWIEDNLDNNEVDFYYEDMMHKQKSFEEWENINSLDDLHQLKNILKRVYSEESNEQIKNAILQAIVCFVEKEDKDFYEKINENVFEFQDISAGLDILLSCYEGINKAKNDDHFWILELSSGESRLMRGQMCISNCKHSCTSIFKAIKANKYLHFAKKYYINAKYFPQEDKNCNLYLEYIDITKGKSNPSINDLSIKLSLSANDKFFVQEKEVDVISFFKGMIEFQKNYAEQMHCDSATKHKTFSTIINNENTNKEVFNFKSIWLKKYNAYATEIISDMDIGSIDKFDTFELIELFKRFLLHLSIYIMSRYNICIKSELKLSNKNFLELVGLKLASI